MREKVRGIVLQKACREKSSQWGRNVNGAVVLFSWAVRFY